MGKVFIGSKLVIETKLKLNYNSSFAVFISDLILPTSSQRTSSYCDQPYQSAVNMNNKLN